MILVLLVAAFVAIFYAGIAVGAARTEAQQQERSRLARKESQ